LAIVLAAGGCATAKASAPKTSAAGAGENDPAIRRLAQRPTWLFPFFECPADVFPGTEAPEVDEDRGCSTDLQACLDRCEAKDPYACYYGAQHVQAMKVTPDYSEALYLRACRLGVASGCTNRAAGLLNFAPDGSEPWPCANRTFAAMCEFKDPWACTMWGSSLLYGKGVEPDIPRARDALSQGCRFGQDDPACTAALKMLSEAKSGKK
jgi:TPR repeat protein